jgi:hypothetical protein
MPRSRRFVEVVIVVGGATTFSLGADRAVRPCAPRLCTLRLAFRWPSAPGSPHGRPILVSVNFPRRRRFRHRIDTRSVRRRSRIRSSKADADRLLLLLARPSASPAGGLNRVASPTPRHVGRSGDPIRRRDSDPTSVVPGGSLRSAEGRLVRHAQAILATSRGWGARRDGLLVRQRGASQGETPDFSSARAGLDPGRRCPPSGTPSCSSRPRGCEGRAGSGSGRWSSPRGDRLGAPRRPRRTRQRRAAAPPRVRGTSRR